MLEKLFEKRSELPDAGWQEWLPDVLGGSDTPSGLYVTEEQSLKLSAVYAAVNLLGNSIGKLPFQMFERTENGRQRQRDHPIAKIIEKRPNPFTTPFNFKKTMEVHRNLWGNAYANIECNRAGMPIALWILNPRVTKPYYDWKKRTLWYVTQLPDGTYRKMHYDEVIHLTGMVIDGFEGKSPIRTSRDSLGNVMATQNFIGSFYKNGTTTKGIMKVPQQLDKPAKDKLREEWEKANGGLDNASRIAILDAGLEFDSISMPLADAQFIQTLKGGLADIARIFNVPLHKLQELDRATFNNIEHLNLEYHMDTMEPILVSWEQEIEYKLFLEEDAKKYYLKFNVNSLLRTDIKSRAEYHRIMANIGAESINEIRDLEDKNRIINGDGHYIMLNMASVDILDEIQLAKAKGVKKKDGEGA